MLDCFHTKNEKENPVKKKKVLKVAGHVIDIFSVCLLLGLKSQSVFSQEHRRH